MQTSDFEENLNFAKKKIAEFVLAAKQSGFKIIGFIDKAHATGEALDKWFERRTKELESGRRNVFAKLSTVVGSIFTSLGVEVHYSTIDCDDTIAAFAHKVSKKHIVSPFFQFQTGQKFYLKTHLWDALCHNVATE